MKTSLIVLLVMLCLLSVVPVAHAQDGQVRPDTAQDAPTGSDSVGTEINIPIIGGCQRILARIWNPVQSVAMRLEGLKSVTYYRDAEFNGVVHFLNWTSMCMEIRGVCQYTNPCMIQVVIDDPLTNNCWKSVIVSTYRGGQVTLVLSNEETGPGQVCKADIILPNGHSVQEVGK